MDDDEARMKEFARLYTTARDMLAWCGVVCVLLGVGLLAMIGVVGAVYGTLVGGAALAFGLVALWLARSLKVTYTSDRFRWSLEDAAEVRRFRRRLRRDL